VLLVIEQVLCVGPPALLQGHSITMIGNSCYVFGGLDGSKPPGPTNELYVLKVRSHAVQIPNYALFICSSVAVSP
jgi:hypothetical protein